MPFNCHDRGIPFDFCGLMFLMVVMILVFPLINMVLCSFLSLWFFFLDYLVLHSSHRHAFSVPPNHHDLDVPHGCYGLVFLVVVFFSHYDFIFPNHHGFVFLLIIVLCSYVPFDHDSFVVILVHCDLGDFHVHCDILFLLIVMVLCSFYFS